MKHPFRFRSLGLAALARQLIDYRRVAHILSRRLWPRFYGIVGGSVPRTLACTFAHLSNARRPAEGSNTRLDNAGHRRQPRGCQKLSESKQRSYLYVPLRTGRTQKEDLLAGLESGADDYQTKPFDAQELRARLHVGQRIWTCRTSRSPREKDSVPGRCG